MGTDGETETLAYEPRPPSKDNEVRTQNDGDPDNAILVHKCFPDLLVTRRGHYLHTRRRSQVQWRPCVYYRGRICGSDISFQQFGMISVFWVEGAGYQQSEILNEWVVVVAGYYRYYYNFDVIAWCDLPFHLIL